VQWNIPQQQRHGERRESEREKGDMLSNEERDVEGRWGKEEEGSAV